MELTAKSEMVDENRIEILVEVSPAEANTLLERFTIMMAYQKDVKPKQGQELEEAIIEMVGEEEFKEYLSEAAMRYSFPFAAENQGLTLVGRPALTAVSDLKKDAPFSFKVLGVVKPSYELSSYEPVEITVPKLEVTEEDINRYMKALAEEHKYVEEGSEHDKIEKGDEVELEITTFRDGVRCDQLCSESRAYTTGAGQMPEDFDKGVMEMHVGETKTIEYDYPGSLLDENNQPKLEHYVSTVKVLKAQKTIIPEFTDEWIEENMQSFNNYEELLKDVVGKIEKRKTTEYRHYKNLLCVQEYEKRFEATIPEVVYDAMVDEVLYSMDEELNHQGSSREEFIKTQGITEKQLRDHLADQVHEQLVRQFVLDSIAKHFELEVTDEDLDNYFRAASQPGVEAMMRLDYERNGRMHEANLAAIRLKANDFITDQATIHVE